MTFEENLQLALINLAKGCTDLPIAWPNDRVVPSVTVPHARVSLFPAAGFNFSYRSGEKKQGIMQVTVVWPKNDGPYRAKAKVGAICEYFVGKSEWSENVKVKTTKRPDEMSAQPTDTSWETPISVYYEAFVN